MEPGAGARHPSEEVPMDNRYHISGRAGIPTPALVFYEDQIEANTRKVVALAGDPLKVRPHVKTHKTKEIITLQMGQGIRKFKTATIAESEMAAQAGAPDVLLAYPLVGPNQERFLELCQTYPETRFSAVFDDLDQLTILAARAQASGTTVDMFLDLDPGLHRTGVLPEDAADLYDRAARIAGVRLAGLHGYDGQNHQTDLPERNKAAQHFHGSVMSLVEQLKARKHLVPTVVLGGTPTFPAYLALGGVEVSPGTCFLQDGGYGSHFPDQVFEPAALVLTRVISRHPAQNTFTLDLGHKALAADPPGVRGTLFNKDPGFAEPVFQNEEHWVFRVNGAQLPRIGEEFYVLPTHICPTVALHARAHVVSPDGTWTKDWEICGRNRTLGI